MNYKCDTYHNEQVDDHEVLSRLPGGSKYKGSKDTNHIYNPSGDLESPK